MPTSSRSALRFLVPLLSLRGEDAALRGLRFAGGLMAVLTPLFGVVYGGAVPEAYDPLWARVAIAGGGVALVGLSFADTAVRRHPAAVLGAAMYGVLAWFGYLMYANALSPPYTTGYLFVVVATAMVYSTLCTSPGPLAALLLTACAIGAGAAWGVESPAMAPSVLMVTLVPGAAIVYFAFWSRLGAVRALQASEAGLGDAERLARIGSWSLDLRTGERTWSPGVYQIMGRDPAEGPTSPFDYIHGEDRARIEGDIASVVQSREVKENWFRVVRPSGEVRHLRTVARVLRDGEGAPERVQGVFLDITEQAAHEADLRAARDEAEAAAAAKSAFLANMSHEIRTPLTAIIGFAQILREEAEGAHADLIEPIESGGRRLLETLNSVLDLARMDAGETDLDLVPTPLVEEVRGVTNLLRGQAHDKGLTLSVEAPDTEVVVEADAAALARVLTNLLSNAVKFTKAGGVSVVVRPGPRQVAVEVADTGRGMDDATLARVFEPFQQATSGWARSHEGTGLGLTITRRLVEAMRGTIRAESTPGVGSRFIVTLPYTPAPEAVSAPERVAA